MARSAREPAVLHACAARALAGVVVALCLTATARPQTPAPLATTAAGIEERLAQGAVDFALHVHDGATKRNWTVKKRSEASHLKVDPLSCQLSYHWKVARDAVVEQDVDLSVRLRDIEKIEVLAVEQDIKENDAKDGYLQRSSTSDPRVYTLKLLLRSSSNVFNFYDPDTADRAGTALARVVERCGGARPTLALHGPPPPSSPATPAATAIATATAVAQPPADPGTIWVPTSGRRIALVIGNSAYGPASGGNIWPDLEGGPHRDAAAIAARLRQLGFTVTETRDRTLDQMNADLRQLAASVTQDSLALFYFSGHGTRGPRANGEPGEDNYLVPVGSRLVYDHDAENRAISLTKVRNLVQRARAAVVILDACRNDSLRRPEARAALVRGFAGAEAASGLLLAYSTAAGEVAGNRPGQTSLYTQTLVDRLGRRGETLTTAFRSVRLQLARSGSSRLPELADALNQDIVLVP
jgi:hypothetical protein